MRANRAVVSLAVCVSGLVYGQPVVVQKFEVASIRPTNAEPSSGGIKSGHGRITAINVTLKRCIMGAYALGPNLISGGPGWLDSDRFDITATADQNVGDEILMGMLQTLLAERFKLAVHREMKPIQAYVLDVAKNGPKLEKGDGGESSTSNGRGDIVAANTSMDRFAVVLSRQLDLPVVNHTGIDGAFHIRLQWTPDNARPAKPTDAAGVEGPSIFTAIQAQLGLRLHTQKVPVEVLVIDRAEKPTEN